MSTHEGARRAADAAWRAITEHRDSIHGFRVSTLTGCPRQIHYRANNTPVTDHLEPRLQISAHLGTAIHDLFLPYFAKAWTDTDPAVGMCAVEPEIRLERHGFALTGHPDIIAWYRDNTADVWDLKSHDQTRFDAIAAGEFSTSERSWIQVWGYARIIELSTGRHVNRCHLYHLDRSDPEAFRDYRRSARRFTDTADYTDEHRDIADKIINAGFAAVTQPEDKATRWFGTDQSRLNSPYSACRSCQWQTRCLGKPVVCEDGDAVVADGVAAEVIRGWQAARGLKSESAAALKQFIRLQRDAKNAAKSEGRLKDLIADLGLPLGETFVCPDTGIRYRLYESGATETIDIPAMKELLASNGFQIPRQPKARALNLERLPPE